MKCQTVKKGVVLTHQNMTSSLMACCVRACNLMGHERSQNEVYLAFLPLAHIFEITQEIIVLSLGIKVGYSSPSTLTDSSTGIVPGQLGDISVLKPTVMAAVPIILDRIYKALRCVLNNNGYKISVWTIFILLVKYRGPILLVTSQALGSDNSTFDQSATSIQIILPEPAVT